MDDFFITSTARYISRICKQTKEISGVEKAKAQMDSLFESELKGFTAKTRVNLKTQILEKMRELKGEK